MKKFVLAKEEDSKVFGVCAGLSKALDVPDPFFIRLIFALLAIFGPGVILYLACYFAMEKSETP